MAKTGIDYRMFPGEIIFRYQNRIWLLVFGWPKLAFFAVRSAVKPQLASKPDLVVLGSHIEVLIFSIVRALRLRRKPA